MHRNRGSSSSRSSKSPRHCWRRSRKRCWSWCWRRSKHCCGRSDLRRSGWWRVRTRRVRLRGSRVSRRCVVWAVPAVSAVVTMRRNTRCTVSVWAWRVRWMHGAKMRPNPIRRRRRRVRQVVGQTLRRCGPGVVRSVRTIPPCAIRTARTSGLAFCAAVGPRRRRWLVSVPRMWRLRLPPRVLGGARPHRRGQPPHRRRRWHGGIVFRLQHARPENTGFGFQ